MKMGLTLLIAGAGAMIAQAMGAPLAFLLGPLVAVVAATALRVPIARLPDWLITPMRVVLGVSIGASFSPALLASLASSGLVLLAVPIYAALATVIGMVVYAGLGRYDRAEAFFSAMPGGIYTMTGYAEDLGLDIRRIAIAHSLRVMIIVICVPIAVWAFDIDALTTTASAAQPLLSFTSSQIIATVAAGLAGYGLFRALPVKIPGGAILVPMLVSSGLHMSGVTDAPAASEGLALAQIILGAAIGARFIGEDPKLILRALPMAMLCVFLTGLLSVVMGWQVFVMTGQDPISAMLALAPGGMPEMSVIAASLGLDAAYVTAMHLARVLLVLGAGPLVWRLIAPRQ